MNLHVSQVAAWISFLGSLSYIAGDGPREIMSNPGSKPVFFNGEIKPDQTEPVTDFHFSHKIYKRAFKGKNTCMIRILITLRST